MGDLRVKAQNILTLKQEEKERSLEKMLLIKQNRAKVAFRDKIQKEIDGFKLNLLESANNGEALKIDVVEIEETLSLDRDDDANIERLTQYIPIESKIATFLNETNFEFISDEIIVDEVLLKLYRFICDNGIYPVWRVQASSDGTKKSILLYLEVNPLLSFSEQKASLEDKKKRRKALESDAVILYQRSVKKLKKIEKLEKLRDFVMMFLLTLYISIVLLTLLASGLDFLPFNEMRDSFSVVAFAWPYFMFTGLSHLFVISFPFGVTLSFLITYILITNKK